jgi:hypothetical protein
MCDHSQWQKDKEIGLSPDRPLEHFGRVFLQVLGNSSTAAPVAPLLPHSGGGSLRRLPLMDVTHE